MPIILSTPISGPVVTQQEIVGFGVDLTGGLLSIQFAQQTDAGEIVGQSSGATSLYTPLGAPKFTPAEYAMIKAAIYRIALEDGLVAGQVA